MPPSIEGLLRKARVIPVITLEDANVALDLARALAAGGLTTIEITLRTAAGLEAITRIARNLPDCVVGAGTIMSADDMDRAVTAGARFVVSPGATDGLYAAAARLDVSFLPGAVTASEIMRGIDAGYNVFKFYPAEESGGVAFLKNIGLPFPQVRFCPTGGLTAMSAAHYAKLANVIAVGGFWMAPKELIAERNWATITNLARTALE